MEEIVIKNLTKDYGDGRGIFDLNFSINKGETFGFVGTNGSGKTTTIRSVMGFIKADKGEVTVRGLDAWKDAEAIKKFVSYIPGEIAFPDLLSGNEFLKNQAEFQGQKDTSKAQQYIKRLKLDPSAPLKRMSKGMKQKTAIIAALMKDADILTFDEPTTGLDPLMRREFLKIVKEEKAKNKTIFISSQSFEELEETCDRVALIIDGKIVEIADINQLHNSEFRQYKVEFLNEEDYDSFKKLKFNIIRDQKQYNQVTVKVEKKNVKKLFEALKPFAVKFISEVNVTLEKHFKEKLNVLHKKVIPFELTKKDIKALKHQQNLEENQENTNLDNKQIDKSNNKTDENLNDKPDNESETKSETKLENNSEETLNGNQKKNLSKKSRSKKEVKNVQ